MTHLITTAQARTLLAYVQCGYPCNTITMRPDGAICCSNTGMSQPLLHILANGEVA